MYDTCHMIDCIVYPIRRDIIRSIVVCTGKYIVLDRYSINKHEIISSIKSVNTGYPNIN